MAELMVSFLNNIGLLSCYSNCISKKKFKLEDINFCGFEEILNNKTKISLNEKNKGNNYLNFFNSKKNYDISKYYMDGCIKKKNVIYNLDDKNLNTNNNCSTFKDNIDQSISNTVIDLENEVIIDNFHLDNPDDYKKIPFNNEQVSIKFIENEFKMEELNKKSKEKVKTLKNRSSHLSNATVSRSPSIKKITNKNYNCTFSKRNTKESNIKRNKVKNKKKNLFSYSSSPKKVDISFPFSATHKDAASDASSEFFSVISNLKSNI